MPVRCAWRRCVPQIPTWISRGPSNYFIPQPEYAPGIHPTAVIAESAEIGAGAHIGPYCYVDEDVRIGKNAVLHSFVTIYRGATIGDDFFAHAHATVREDCRIGNRVLLQNGVVVGSDGFGFARQPNGRWYKMRQSGITVIGDDVEIQANAAIDRATVGETHIGRGTKIDNLVQVGHACKVGEDTLLCGQVGLAGTTNVGNRCILAGQVGAAGHLTIGDGAIVTAQSGVPADVPPRRHLFRLSRDGQSCLAKIGRRFQPPAGTAARTARIAAGSRPPSRKIAARRANPARRTALTIASKI